MAGVLIGAALEADEGNGEAIHGSREGCRVGTGGFCARKRRNWVNNTWCMRGSK